MSEFIVAVECAIEHQGKFLMIERPQGGHAEGLLAFPGGKVELSDAENGLDLLSQAARREVLEEVGLTLGHALRYVTSSCFIDSKTGGHVLDVIFHSQLTTEPGDLQVCPREVPSHSWMTYQEIVEAPNCPQWLPGYLDQLASLSIQTEEVGYE